MNRSRRSGGRGPRSGREAGRALVAGGGLALAFALAAAGCFGRQEGLAHPSPMSAISGPRSGPGLDSMPDLAPEAVGKPYRDLRRHTTGRLGPVSGLDVSPDGSTLLFASAQDGPAPNIYLKREGAAGLVRKTSGRSWDIHPRFSPDGRWIAFASNRDGNFDIWIIPADGAGGCEQVTSSPDDEVHPAWSPDGKKIAFSRLSGKHGWNLWILDREEGSAVELGPGLFPDWSPTGEWIAFQKPSESEPPRFGIWIIRPDGSEVRQVVAGDAFFAEEPVWSPAGDLLAFTASRGTSGDARRSGGGGICAVELTRGRIYRLSEGPGTCAMPAWGLGGRIYFVSDRVDGPAIWSLLPPEVRG